MKIIFVKKLMRPFTLVYPAMAMLSGSLLALNLSTSPLASLSALRIIAGIFIAPLLNAASNIINQIYDLEIDKINKPTRPLPNNDMTIKEAFILVISYTVICLVASWFISLHFFILVISAFICTLAYSVPPARTKRFHWYANLTMAIPRGLLLIVAGWSTISPISEPTPWLFGSILFLYILGANTAKDFSDIEGDKANEVVSLPIKYGDRTPKLIKPFFIFPFLIVIIYCAVGWLNWIFSLLVLFSFLGYKTIRLIEKEPDLRHIDDNHPSWKLMYQTVAFYTLSIAILSFFVNI